MTLPGHSLPGLGSGRVITSWLLSQMGGERHSTWLESLPLGLQVVPETVLYPDPSSCHFSSTAPCPGLALGWWRAGESAAQRGKGLDERK